MNRTILDGCCIKFSVHDMQEQMMNLEESISPGFFSSLGGWSTRSSRSSSVSSVGWKYWPWLFRWYTLPVCILISIYSNMTGLSVDKRTIGKRCLQDGRRQALRRAHATMVLAFILQSWESSHHNVPAFGVVVRECGLVVDSKLYPVKTLVSNI